MAADREVHLRLVALQTARLGQTLFFQLLLLLAAAVAVLKLTALLGVLAAAAVIGAAVLMLAVRAIHQAHPQFRVIQGVRALVLTQVGVRAAARPLRAQTERLLGAV